MNDENPILFGSDGWYDALTGERLNPQQLNKRIESRHNAATPKLIIFDLDGTLTPFDGDELYPDAARYFADHPTTQPVIATNQGGIGLRHWMESDSFGEPQKYPTLFDFNTRIARLFFKLPVPPLVLMCAAYQSKKTGQWGPTPKDGDRATVWNKGWRKPQPGMLMHAIERAGCAPNQTLMVGDGVEDQQAAKYATCKFQWAWEFFGREQPEDKWTRQNSA